MEPLRKPTPAEVGQQARARFEAWMKQKPANRSIVTVAGIAAIILICGFCAILGNLGGGNSSASTTPPKASATVTLSPIAVTIQEAIITHGDVSDIIVKTTPQAKVNVTVLYECSGQFDNNPSLKVAKTADTDGIVKWVWKSDATCAGTVRINVGAELNKHSGVADMEIQAK
jgi:hypothetical protein